MRRFSGFALWFSLWLLVYLWMKFGPVVDGPWDEVLVLLLFALAAKALCSGYRYLNVDRGYK